MNKNHSLFHMINILQLIEWIIDVSRNRFSSRFWVKIKNKIIQITTLIFSIMIASIISFLDYFLLPLNRYYFIIYLNKTLRPLTKRNKSSETNHSTKNQVGNLTISFIHSQFMNEKKRDNATIPIIFNTKF